MNDFFGNQNNAVAGVGAGRVQPGQVQPGQVQPGQIRPGQVQPGQVQPGQVRPGQVRPGQVQPGQVQPGQIRPGQVQPGQVQPGQPQPGQRPVAGNLPGIGANNQPQKRPGNRTNVGNNTDNRVVAGNNVNKVNNVNDNKINRGGDTNINVGNVNVGNSVNYSSNKQAWVDNQHNNGNVVRANTGNRYWGAYNNTGFHGAVVAGGYPYYHAPAFSAPGYGWQAATWAGVGAFMGASLANQQPVYYAYGTGGNVYYENNTVYVDGQAAGTSQEYLEQAQALVAAAPPVDQQQDWMPLGVFAFTREDVPDSQSMLELVVSKSGVVAGTYHNEATGVSRPVKGTADPNSLRVALGFADGKNPEVVLETGIYNLTQDESPALLHIGADQSQPVMLVRLQKPEGK